MKRSVVVVLLVTALVALVAPPASAATPSATASAGWQTNGTVHAVAYAGDAVYLGGAFTAVRAPGRNTTPVTRNNVAAFSASTGQLLPWDPNADRTVRAIAVGPSGTVYLGGQFTTVRGSKRPKLAAVTGDTGVPTSWSPRPDALVLALALSPDGGTVYAGGDFTVVSTAPRRAAVALDAASGAVLPWRADVSNADPTLFSNVTSLSVATGRVYLGGTFTLVDGTARTNTAAVDPATGALLSWRAKTSATVLGLASDGGRVVVVGRGGGGFLRAFSATTGSQLWDSHADGDVQAVALRGTEVYVGGHFNAVRSVTRHHLAALDVATGAVLAWDPGVDGSLGVEGLATDAGHLAAGGNFTFIGGRSQQNFAQFAG